MQTRKVRRFVCGKWMDIKWSDINRGDVIRVYDREYGHHDGATLTFCAVDDSYVIGGVGLFGQNLTQAFKYARLDDDGQITNPEIFVMTNASRYNVHDCVKAGTQKRWRNLKKRPKGTKKEK